MNLEILAQAILDFWFGPLTEEGTASPEKSQTWFAVDPAFDSRIRKRFVDDIEAGFMGGFDRWAVHPFGRTALIVLLDQFPRNIYRGTARAFYYDGKALALALEAHEQGLHKTLPAAYAHFVLLPLMHCEHLEIQDLCLQAFEQLVTLHRGEALKEMEVGLAEAKRHRDLIVRFGRFPARNASLGRTATPEELSFLSR